jgi:hypothetical protein
VNGIQRVPQPRDARPVIDEEMLCAHAEDALSVVAAEASCWIRRCRD